MANTRVETDSLGDINVPENALYGAQTQRAINNFPISATSLPESFIRAIILIKMAAAKANDDLGCLDTRIAKNIVLACKELLDEHDLMQHFPVDVFQTGSGTSTNMNVNEVLAHIASLHYKQAISANDHVNFGQSSNDVIPTAIHVSSAIAVTQQLLPALNHLFDTINKKGKLLADFCKTGRTHLMDAMPIRFDQVLSGWAYQIQGSIHRLTAIQGELHQLPQGGTAVGTGVNTHVEFAARFNKHMSKMTGQPFTKAPDFFALIAGQETSVALSGVLKTLAVTLMKISNDLRWMNSGPLSGFEEIRLEALQPGSSIMPGKVNPVIPEAVAMVSAQVIGNDSTITIAGQSGNFELNVMLPVIADNLLKSVNMLGNASRLLADKAIMTFTVNEERLEQNLKANPILVTALNPVIGYERAAKIAKKAYDEKKAIIDVARQELDMSEEALQKLLDPVKLTKGGF